MKIITLIIGLFICLLGFGQDRMMNGDTIFHSSEEDVIKYSIQDNNTMIYLLLKYKEECYNDSTANTYDFYEWGDVVVKRLPSIDLGFTPNYIGRKTIYDHKQPTFDGFIEWIEQIKNK